MQNLNGCKRHLFRDKYDLTEYSVMSKWRKQIANICLSKSKRRKDMDENRIKDQIREYWNENAESFDEAHANEDKEK